MHRRYINKFIYLSSCFTRAPVQESHLSGVSGGVVQPLKLPDPAFVEHDDVSTPVHCRSLCLPFPPDKASCVQLLRTLTTWHCPHSHAATAIDRYLLLQRVCCCGPMLYGTDKRTDRQTDGLTPYRYMLVDHTMRAVPIMSAELFTAAVAYSFVV